MKELFKDKKKLVIIGIFLFVLLVTICLGVVIGKKIANSNGNQVNPEAKKYTVSLDYGDGSELIAFQVNENETFTKPTDPTMDGYIFAGWYLNDVIYNFDTKITKNITLVAKWKTSVNGEFISEDAIIQSGTSSNNKTIYKVTTASDNQITQNYLTIQNICQDGNIGGLIVSSYASNKSLNLKDALVNLDFCEGYELDGWYINDQKINPADYKIDHDITVTAKWQEKTHTIYFDTNGGSYVAPITFSEKGTYLTEPITTKTGYSFIKWNQEDGQEFVFFNTVAGFTADQHLTAEWSKIITTQIDKYVQGMRISPGRFAFSVCTSEVFLASTYSSTNAEVYLYTSDSENGKYFLYGSSNENLNIGDDGGSYAVMYLENNPNYIKIRIHDNNSDLDVITPPMKVADYSRC